MGPEYDENTFPVTAMAVVEELPAGWTYEGIASGPKPTLELPAGHPGPLQFIWVDIPKFPATFSYRVRVPGGETGVRTITGQALYRTDGPQAETAAVETPLSPVEEVHR
ncbi:MAG: hypothetical protein KA184_12450 [Candidatus Hydrogenedentes bacterium]|nr:hypothetical protein [Candidatus Hydrogenedentota bacterium]